MAILTVIGGGIAGGLLSYGLTLVRERRRSLDAYRAPQRRAIGDIITATHGLMMCELEKRTVMTELVEKIRQQAHSDAPGEELMAAEKAMGSAMLGVDRAFAIGMLTIVDAPCFEAMGAAYFEFQRLRGAIKTGATEKETLEEIEEYIRTIAGHATQFNKDVSALVRAAQDRVSPAERFWNRWRRRHARNRLGKLYQRMYAVDMPDDQPPQPSDHTARGQSP